MYCHTSTSIRYFPYKSWTLSVFWAWQLRIILILALLSCNKKRFQTNTPSILFLYKAVFSNLLTKSRPNYASLSYYTTTLSYTLSPLSLNTYSHSSVFNSQFSIPAFPNLHSVWIGINHIGNSLTMNVTFSSSFFIESIVFPFSPTHTVYQHSLHIQYLRLHFDILALAVSIPHTQIHTFVR